MISLKTFSFLWRFCWCFLLVENENHHECLLVLFNTANEWNKRLMFFLSKNQIPQNTAIALIA